MISESIRLRSLQILEQAERERLEVATQEAQRGCICKECEDAGRKSICQEIREGLRIRGLWAPETDSDLITAIFSALDRKESQ